MCTANVCRSPVGAAFLARELGDRGIAARVTSAGRLSGGWPTTPENVEVMRTHGVDLAAHRSTEATPALVRDSDLVLGMAHEHVRDALALDPDAWPRAFTLKELVRRGEAVGARRAGETVPGWLARAAGDRDISTVLGSSPGDDVPDPMGRSIARYEATVDEIEQLVAAPRRARVARRRPAPGPVGRPDAPRGRVTRSPEPGRPIRPPAQTPPIRWAPCPTDPTRWRRPTPPSPTSCSESSSGRTPRSS